MRGGLCPRGIHVRGVKNIDLRVSLVREITQGAPDSQGRPFLLSRHLETLELAWQGQRSGRAFHSEQSLI